MFLFIVFFAFNFVSDSIKGVETSLTEFNTYNAHISGTNPYKVSLDNSTDIIPWEMSLNLQVLSPPRSEKGIQFTLSTLCPKNSYHTDLIEIAATKYAVKMAIRLVNNDYLKFLLTDDLIWVDPGISIDVLKERIYIMSPGIALHKEETKGLNFLKGCYRKNLLPNEGIQVISNCFSPHLFNFLKEESFLTNHLFDPLYGVLDNTSSSYLIADLLVSHLNTMLQFNIIENETEKTLILFKYINNLLDSLQSTSTKYIQECKKQYLTLVWLNNWLKEFFFNPSQRPSPLKNDFVRLQKKIDHFEKTSSLSLGRNE